MTVPEAADAAPTTDVRDGIRHTPVWRYSLGMFGTSIPINMLKGSMLAFYVDHLGLEPAFYASAIVIYAVVDAIDNPVFGFLSDRTRTRWGRRRPWLVAGAPLLGLGLIGFFAVPEGTTGVALMVWFLVFALLTEMTDSLLNANYGALLPELFPVERVRAQANSLRQGFQLIAMVISLALTPTLTTKVFGTEDSTTGYTITAVLYAVLGAGVIMFMALGVRERADYSAVARPRVGPTVRALLGNRWFWQIGLAGACYGSAMALVLNGLQLYVKYSLGEPLSSATILQGVVILATGLGLLGWIRLVRRFGAGRMWRIAFTVFACGFVPLFFAHSLVGGVLGGLVLAIGWSGMLSTNDLIVARVLDEDAARAGQHREGAVLSAFGMFGRLNELVIAAAITLVAAWFGYHGADDPGPDPGMAFRVYLAVFPLVLAAVGAAIAWLIRLPRNRAAALEPAASQPTASEPAELEEA